MDRKGYRARRITALLTVVIGVIAAVVVHPTMWQPVSEPSPQVHATGTAAELLKTLPIKGRAAKTGYERTRFGEGWARIAGCDMRNIILNRDLKNVAVGLDCKVQAGTLTDPYTGKIIEFVRGAQTSDDVQIDHVVALSDAWQKGAQLLTQERREALANDPLELIAVDGEVNQAKSDGDAASWLPPNKAFRCQYVARQIAVKSKYQLWVTQAEHDAMIQVLGACPGQSLPSA